MGALPWCRKRRLARLVVPLAAVVACGMAGSARAEAGSQAELTCALDSGELLDSATAAPVSSPPWQGLASLRRGDESRVRLAVARDDVGFWPAVTTTALLRLELGLAGRAAASANGNETTAAVRDVSSWLGVGWQVSPSVRLSLRAFPFDTDYWRLGYLHALDWGGTDAQRGESIFLGQRGGAPGVEVSLTAPRLRLFSGVKWARVGDVLRGERRLWGVLSGGSFELSPALRVDAGFGYFQRPALVPEAGHGASFVEGASLRFVWHRGVFEPELSAEPFRPAPFDREPRAFEAEALLGVALALEASLLVQRLRRFEAPQSTTLTPAPAAALYGSARGRRLAAHLVVAWQSLAFALRNDARLARGQTLPPSSVPRAELSAWLGGNVTLQPLVPSFEVGLRLPAALETPSVLPGFGQTLLLGGPAGLEALPVGAGRLPVLAARLALRFQASASLALSLSVEYQRNPNRVAPGARGFGEPDSLGGVVAAQARF
ncbi:MAG TPA: hypothetical protein VHP33_21900 [Polyangiaceae bacterium]|nr:hypothetical protein [Polyangiaceae bacterium]